jgi:WD40 repeat protein
VLEGHDDEIFSCAFNYEGDTIITGSKDNTCRIWKDQYALKGLKKPKTQEAATE